MAGLLLVAGTHAQNQTKHILRDLDSTSARLWTLCNPVTYS